MKYILINLIVLVSLSQAVQEFIYIKPVSIEYAPTQKESEKKVKTVQEKEEEVFNENAQNMWANAGGDSFDMDDYEEESEGNSSSKCTTISGFTVDKDGCPQTYRLKTKFENKKSDLVIGMKEELKEFSLFLKEHPTYQVLIYSYTDSIGEEEENKLITQKRAKVINKILLDYGVSSTKLTAIGKGEKEELKSNMSKEGRAQNNRIEIELIN